MGNRAKIRIIEILADDTGVFKRQCYMIIYHQWGASKSYGAKIVTFLQSLQPFGYARDAKCRSASDLAIHLLMYLQMEQPEPRCRYVGLEPIDSDWQKPDEDSFIEYVYDIEWKVQTGSKVSLSMNGMSLEQFKEHLNSIPDGETMDYQSEDEDSTQFDDENVIPSA